MNTILYAGVALAMLTACSGAHAADLPSKMPAYAPAAATDYWTGFYVGAHAGHGWGTLDWFNTDNFAGLFDGRGFLAGGQLGLNHQIGNGWVLGIEADASWSRFAGSQTVVRGAIANNFYFKESVESKIDWMASVALRFGVAADRLLVYSKIGAAIVHERHSHDWLRFILGPTSYAVSGDETRAGLLVGFGAEHALSGNWSTKIEYNHVAFADKPLELAGTQTDAGVTTLMWFNQRIGQSLHIVKAGVNYRLGSAPAAAVTTARTAGYDWSGFYLGAQAGYDWGRTTWSDFLPDQSYDTSGWLAGGQIGFNAQSGKIVFGVEAEGLWTNADGALVGSFLNDPVSGPSRDALATRVNWIGMVTGRIGYAVAGRWLIYGKGGVAFANERHDFDRTFPASPLPSFELRQSTQRLRSGWVAGAGIEHAIAGSWSMKAEYNYIGFQDRFETLTGVEIDGPGTVSPAAAKFEILRWMQLAKIGLNYRFQAQPPAIAARY